jgi:type IV pilus assembly protein PilQ
VVVNDDFSRDLGVRLGVTGYRENGTDGAAVISGTGTGTDTMVNSIVDNLGTTGQITPVELPILTDRYNVNVPIAEAAGRFSLAVLERDYLVDLELTALEAEGRGESSGATTVQFKKAVLSLEVTPQITPDNNIIMDLRVHKDNVGDIISTGGLGGTVPSIDTRAVETQVLVEDGQTVVLGGIYETERRETITKVPFLGDIPAIGVLFRSKQLQNDKSELLIFVTPRILEEGSTIY